MPEEPINICPGYTGLLDIGAGSAAGSIRCTDFDVNTRQEVEFYDHIIGLRDTITDDVKGGGAPPQIQRTFWRAGTRLVSGSFSFPATEYAYKRPFFLSRTADFFDMAFIYYSGLARTFRYCRVNSFNMSIVAGDILTMSVDVMGMVMAEGAAATTYEGPEKLITWDKVQVTLGDLDIIIQGLQLDINNNIQPVYTCQSNIDHLLEPLVLRVGMQEITGVISVYNDGGSSENISDIDEPIELTITVADMTWKCPVVLMPVQRSGAIGPNISTMPFVGVDRGFNEDGGGA